LPEQFGHAGLFRTRLRRHRTEPPQSGERRFDLLRVFAICNGGKRPQARFDLFHRSATFLEHPRHGPVLFLRFRQRHVLAAELLVPLGFRQFPLELRTLGRAAIGAGFRGG